MEEADTNAALHRPKPRFRKRRMLGAILLALLLLWLGWRSAVSRMDFPRLIICPPLPALKANQTLDGSPTLGALALSPDGKTLWSGGNIPFVNSGKRSIAPPLVLPIYAWDAHTGRQLYSLPGHLRQVSALACSPDGRWLASSGWDNTIKLWDTQTRQLVWSQPDEKATLLFSPDGKLLWTGSELRDAGTGRVLRSFRLPPHGHFNGDMDDMAGAAFSQDGRTLACIAGDPEWVKASPAQQAASGTAVHIRGQRIYLWDVASGRLKTIFPLDQTRAVAFSPDGRSLACICNSGQMMGGTDGSAVRVLDAVTGAEKWHWERQDDPDWFLLCLTYSPNGEWLAAETMNHDVVLFSAATGNLFKRLHIYEPPHGGSFQMTHSALAFSSDGKTLVGRGDNTVQVWDTSSLP